MLFPFAWTALVTLAALVVYIATMMRVGRLREREGVKAPSTDGSPDFNRAYRVQMNTIEQIVPFVPALWMFSAMWGDRWGALVGVVWPIGRAIYARSYWRAAEARGPGFMIGAVSTIVLLVGTLIGALVRVTM